MGKFTFTQTEIPGVVVIEPQVFGDDRGYFMETYQKDQFAEAGIDKEFVQVDQVNILGILIDSFLDLSTLSVNTAQQALIDHAGIV